MDCHALGGFGCPPITFGGSQFQDRSGLFWQQFKPEIKQNFAEVRCQFIQSSFVLKSLQGIGH